MSVSLHLHSSLIHSLRCTKNDSNNNLFSDDSIVEPTYVLMGSPGHYQLIIIHILHDICLNKLFVIVIVIVIVIVHILLAAFLLNFFVM